MILIPFLLGIIDQAVKYILRQNPNWTYDISQGAFRFFIHIYTNPWAAFSLPVPSRIVAIISLVIIGWLLYQLVYRPGWQRVFMLFLIVGAVSNVFDRLYFGYVIDYIGLGLFSWPVGYFNLADGMIILGVVGWLRSMTARYELEERMRGNGI